MPNAFSIRPTIAFVPREVFSGTQRSLEGLFERTDAPFDLVCIDGNSPPEVASYLEAAASQKGFALLRSESYLTPNQVRNLAIQWAREHTKPEYIVFIDNDVLVRAGWLNALLDCAEATGAGAVGPAYFEGLPECSRLHMFGGDCRIEVDGEGRRSYLERHEHAHTPVADLSEPLVRRETELIEFHTLLVRMSAFDEIGLLDEGLLCQTEHGDLSMTLRLAGYSIWLEPDSKITYLPPQNMTKADRRFFFLRWSEAWYEANELHFTQKWGLCPESRNRSQSWVREHRSLGTTYKKRLRKWLGRKWARSIEKRFFDPFQPAWNRFVYPARRYSQPAPPRIRVSDFRQGAEPTGTSSEVSHVNAN